MSENNKKEFIDGMIWVGQSYKKILCGEKKSCGIPIINKRNKCYVHEAEWRGCCRKIPEIPAWVVPGESKIFLAHKDNLKAKERGRVFGYFVLERIEMIKPPQKVMPLEVNPVSPLQLKRMEKKKGEDLKLPLNGTVYCMGSGRPIKDAVITASPLKGEGIEKAVTDEKGSYKLEFAPGRFNIAVSADGFKKETLQGIEILTDEKSKQDFYLTPEKCEDGLVLKKKCWNGDEIVTHRCENGVWVATGNKCPDLPGDAPKCSDGSVLIQQCWDGSEIITHECRDGRWMPTGESCPEPPPFEPDIPDFSLPNRPDKPDTPDSNSPGKSDTTPGGSPTGRGAPPPPGQHGIPEPFHVSIDFTMFEHHRSCSLRFIPGGIYLVDSLTADITDRFQKKLQETETWEQYKEAKNDHERKEAIQKGNDIFKKILDEFKDSRKTKTTIPPNLEEKVELRGELVLFKEFPVFENYPRAYFRGIRQVDGNRIIKQVANSVPVLEIPYYTSEEDSRRKIMIAQIAEDLKISQAVSERIFKEFIKFFEKELKNKTKLTIHGFGTFSVVHRKERKGINPKTGEKITIPARNAVKFRPAKSLKMGVQEVDLEVGGGEPDEDK